MDIRVQRTIDTIDEQLHRSLGVAELAARVGLSVPQLSRLFKQATGLTPGAFLHQRRMARARLLVERTSLSVADIMTQVGISDRSHFARDFRRSHGLSPRSLRLNGRMTGPCR